MDFLITGRKRQKRTEKSIFKDFNASFPLSCDPLRRYWLSFVAVRGISGMFI